MIEEIEIKNWEEFEEQIKNVSKKTPNEKPYLLFRGHSNCNWHLETTLERYLQKIKSNKTYSWEDYFRVLQTLEPTVSSLTTNEYDLPSNFEYNKVPSPPPGYEFMIYLRHHGFPSPLLDWTRSSYVASFFAFNDASNNDAIAIFSYREHYGLGKITIRADPHIWTLGPTVKTHERHYRQQSEYTICHKKIDDAYIYCCHEEVEYAEEQDRLIKYVIPSIEREKVLAKLDLMNINAYTLFGDEESLMDTLAYREIERKR
jgi:hypothetical protein